MRFRLPVVAYDAAAIGETVGAAGVLLQERDLAETAEAAAMVGEPSALREALVTAGERRGEGLHPREGGRRSRRGFGGSTRPRPGKLAGPRRAAPRVRLSPEAARPARPAR